MVIFYALMNIAGIKSQVIHTANNEDPRNDLKRRYFLKKIALNLLDPHLKLCETETNVPQAVQHRKQEVADTSANNDQQLEIPRNIRKYCSECKNKNRSRYYRQKCKKFVCLKHAKTWCLLYTEENFNQHV
ncbi:hypothetical protein HHI36_019592 [Cryptolaemus montrouzieri]|uniref:PiggyBac transposable element-derived protein 4 C-terminal zinc-ribbon domain-containing protein n=1 Tax=Cryptolaemus montrouzieri TaxID=559131 RepID=A0ABD2N7Y6_9CUCU